MARSSADEFCFCALGTFDPFLCSLKDAREKLWRNRQKPLPSSTFPSLVNWLMYEWRDVRRVMSEMNRNVLSTTDPETDKMTSTLNIQTPPLRWFIHLPGLTRDCSCSTSWRFFGCLVAGTRFFAENFAELNFCCNWRNSTLPWFHTKRVTVAELNTTRTGGGWS